MNILAAIIILWYIIGIIVCTSYMIIYNKKYHQEIGLLDVPLVFLSAIVGPLWIWCLADLLKGYKNDDQ
jgi:hypothetical protein